MTNDSAEEYAQSVLALIQDREKLNQIKAAAMSDAGVYTLDNMVGQFIDGINKCLAQQKLLSE
jgi:hypothetical protein